MTYTEIAIFVIMWVMGILSVAAAHGYSSHNYFYNDGRYMSRALRWLTYICWPIFIPLTILLSILAVFTGGLSLAWWDHFLRWLMRVV